MRLLGRRAALLPLDEAAAYERCHGSRDNDVRIVKLPPRRPRYEDVLTTGEDLRTLFELRLDAREPESAQVERLLALGATEVHGDKRPPDVDDAFLADPEGNCFCAVDTGQMGKPPLAPYPPDLDDDAPPPTDLGELVDVTVEGADWANSRPVRGLEARRVELRRCRFTGAELVEASLSDVTFDDCRLDLVNLRFAKLERVVFRDCRMSECDLYEASLKDVLFERCQLREATFSSATLQRVELRGCDLAGLRGVESLRGARMPWNDVLENAPLFATAVGIEIVD